MAENNTDMDRRGQEVNGSRVLFSGVQMPENYFVYFFRHSVVGCSSSFHYLRTSAVRNLTSGITQCVLSTAYITTLRQIAISDFLLLYAQALCSELILFIYLFIV
jgi:hypothetical protein